MLSFEEQTEQERGFAAIWDRTIAPYLGDYEGAYWKTLIIMSVIWAVLIGVFLFIVGYFQYSEATHFMGVSAQIVNAGAAISFAGIGYLAYRPFQKLRKANVSSFKSAIDEHFSNMLTPYDDEDAIQQAAEDLRRKNILPLSNPVVKAGYQSRDGLFQFYNLQFKQTRQTNNSSTVEYIHYLILEMTLTSPLSAEIRVLSDSVVGNIFQRIFKRNKNVRLGNSEFEKLFEVFSNDAAQVNAIFTPAVQENFVQMQRYFQTRWSWLTGSRKITAGLNGNVMTIAFHGLEDVAGMSMAGRPPKQLVQAARTAIQRIHNTLEIVETLRDVMPIIKRPMTKD